MRIVLDTNVLVSSLWGGPPKKIMESCRSGLITLLASPSILEEYFSVLSRFEIPDEDMDLSEALFADPKRVEIYSPNTPVHAIKQDPSDNKFLECALAAKADFIVSGDKHLRKLESFGGIPILPPRRFLKEIP